MTPERSHRIGQESRVSRAVLVAAVAVALTAGSAGSAQAAGQPGPSQRSAAVTRVTNSGVPGNGGSWAGDRTVRTAILNAVPAGGGQVPPSRCGEAAGPCYGFTAAVTDQGTFRTSAGADPGPVGAGLVPRSAVNAFYVTAWPGQFFPPGTVITGLQLTAWSMSYSARTHCGPHQWTDSSANGYGDLPRDGNILGCPPARHSR